MAKQQVPALEVQTVAVTEANRETLNLMYPGWPRIRSFVRREDIGPELVKCGALLRIGKELVLNVPAYLAWQRRQTERVLDFQIAPNQPKHAAQRFGGPEAIQERARERAHAASERRQRDEDPVPA